MIGLITFLASYSVYTTFSAIQSYNSPPDRYSNTRQICLLSSKQSYNSTILGCVIFFMICIYLYSNICSSSFIFCLYSYDYYFLIILTATILPVFLSWAFITFAKPPLTIKQSTRLSSRFRAIRNDPLCCLTYQYNNDKNILIHLLKYQIFNILNI